MRKIILIAALSLIPFIISAQSVIEKVDEFTGKSIIETSWVKFKSKNSKSNFSFKLRYENDKTYFHLIWENGVNRITKGSELNLKLGNETVITLLACDEFIEEISVYNYLEDVYTRKSIHLVYEGDFSALADNIFVNKIRIETNKGAHIYGVENKMANSFCDACRLIVEKIKNE